jgi:Arc/MetJ family transcription regulator
VATHDRAPKYTCIHIVVYDGVMSRTNIEIDDELVAAAQRMYRLDSKRGAVDLALRRLVGEPLGRDEALALQGSGFDFTNDEIESFSDAGTELPDQS